MLSKWFMIIYGHQSSWPLITLTGVLTTNLEQSWSYNQLHNLLISTIVSTSGKRLNFRHTTAVVGAEATHFAGISIRAKTARRSLGDQTSTETSDVDFVNDSQQMLPPRPPREALTRVSLPINTVRKSSLPRFWDLSPQLSSTVHM